MTPAPVITTDRLVLRRPQLGDLTAYAAYCASDRARFAGGPFSQGEAEAALGRMIAQWDDHGFGRFVITQNGDPIGHAGVLYGDPLEMTWTLWTDAAEGQGIAAEAARACLDWAARRWPGGRLTSMIDPDNHRSVAVARRLGGLPLPAGQFSNGAPATRFLHLLPAPAAPVLRTQRLVLRPHTATDIDALVTLMGTDRSVYMDGPLDPLPAWRWLMSDNALWQTTGFGPWGVERQSDGAFVGQVNVARPPNFPELELGWTLLADFEGHGYAAEAAIAARDWAYDQGVTSLVSYIDPDNHRSIALAERLGALLDTEAPRPDGDGCLVYRHHVYRDHGQPGASA